jgi:hypothetical protein
MDRISLYFVFNAHIFTHLFRYLFYILEYDVGRLSTAASSFEPPLHYLGFQNAYHS